MENPILKNFQYCPRCGSHSFQPKSEQHFQCQDCYFVYYMNAGGTVVGVISNDRGEILFIKRAKDPGKGSLDLPGGFIDFYETAEHALKREIKEEVNLDIIQHRFLFSQPNQYLFREMLYHTIDFFFLCRVQEITKVRSNEEVSGFIFHALHEISLEEIGFESICQGVQTLRTMVQEETITLP